MNALLGAVLLSVVSAVCYATAAIVQERLAATTPPSRYGLLRSGRWWGAVALNSLGAVLHVGALGLGQLTVVQPLGVLTLVLAAPLAALLVKRPVSSAAWHGIILVSAGLAGLLVLTGSATSRALDGPEELTLAGAVAGAVILLVLTATTVGRRVRLLRTVSLATAAGVAYGAASVFVKTVVDSWQTAALVTTLPVALLIAVLAAGGLAASQSSYRGGGLATPLATTTVVNPAFAAAVGIVLLGEGFQYGLLGATGAVVAAVVTAGGLVVLSADSTGHPIRLLAQPPQIPAEGPGPVVIRAPGRLSGAMHEAAVRVPVPPHPKVPTSRS